MDEEERGSDFWAIASVLVVLISTCGYILLIIASAGQTGDIMMAESTIWPPTVAQLEKDRKLAFELWGGKTKWVENIPHSNFLPLKVPLDYRNIEYATIEHFYQSMKGLEGSYRLAISKCETPSRAKFLAGKLKRRGEIREDWEQINIGVMLWGQKHRIETDPVFYDWLRGTRGSYIYEWNNWSDVFWGVSIYTGQGENVLGRVLMSLRDDTFFPKRVF